MNTNDPKTAEQINGPQMGKTTFTPNLSAENVMRPLSRIAELEETVSNLRRDLQKAMEENRRMRKRLEDLLGVCSFIDDDTKHQTRAIMEALKP